MAYQHRLAFTETERNSTSKKSQMGICYRRNPTLLVLVLYWCLHKHKFMHSFVGLLEIVMWGYWCFHFQASYSHDIQAERTSRTLSFNSGQWGIGAVCWNVCRNAGTGATVLVWWLVLKSTRSDAEGKHDYNANALTHVVPGYPMQHCICLAQQKAPTWMEQG